MDPNHLVVEYTPALAEERVARRAAAVRGSLIGLGFLVGIVVIVLIVNRQDKPWSDETYQLWFGVLAGLALARLLITAVFWWVAKRYRARIPQGLAMVVSREGIATADGTWDWPTISRFGTRRRMQFGPEYVLRVGSAPKKTFAVDDLTAFPSAIDSAVRVYSEGAVTLDLRGIDR